MEENEIESPYSLESKRYRSCEFKYILIELPLKNQFNDLKGMITRIKENGYYPILAHPERYLPIQKNFNMLYELQDMGVVFQSNYGSILGNYGFAAQQTMKKMLKKDLITFLGTDSHKQESIYMQIPKAISKISKYLSNERLYELTTSNAEKILEGESL